MRKKGCKDLMEALDLSEEKIDELVDGFRKAARKGGDTWENTMSVLEYAMDTPDLAEREKRHKLLAYMFVRGSVDAHAAGDALGAAAAMLGSMAKKMKGGACECPSCVARRAGKGGAKPEVKARSINLDTLEGVGDEEVAMLRLVLEKIDADPDGDKGQADAIRSALERYDRREAGDAGEEED